MLEALSIVIGYLLGSIPSAYIAGRLRKGIDIRQVGGGNMGTLNAMREISPVIGIIVLLVDIAKGAVAVVIARVVGVDLIVVVMAGFASIVGHCWPVFLGFKGGKGAATTIGVFLVIVPEEMLICGVLILLTIYFTSNFTLGIGVGMTLLPLVSWKFGSPNLVIFCEIGIALFLLLRYLPTALRIWFRTENKKDFIIDRQYKPWQIKRK